MTQRFTEEGRVERVTVLEAGPVPGDRASARTRPTATRPSSSASAPCARRRSPSPSSGTSRRPSAPPLRTLVEFRDEAGELTIGDTVTVESVRGRPASSRSPARARARASRARSSATTSTPARSRTARTTCARRARSAPRRRRRACSRASRAPAAWAASASPSAGLTIVELIPDQNLMLVRGSVPGPEGRHRGGAHRWLTRRSWARTQEAHARRRRVRRARSTARSCTRSCVAELAARRRGTHSTRNRALVRGGGAKPWRQKGTGRARQGSIRAPQFAGGGVVFGPTPRHYTVKVNRKARRAALRSALSVHADRGSVFGLDAGGVRRAVDQAGGRPDRRPPRRLGAARAVRPGRGRRPSSRSATSPA